MNVILKPADCCAFSVLKKSVFIRADPCPKKLRLISSFIQKAKWDTDEHGFTQIRKKGDKFRLRRRKPGISCIHAEAHECDSAAGRLLRF